MNSGSAQQFVLDIGIEVQRDVNGIEMGVLENGIPFLTQRGLSRVAGVSRSVIFDINKEWEESNDDSIITRNRISALRKSLLEKGYRDSKLYIETIKDGTVHHAYPDVVCMAIIEYYAFESKPASSTAIDSFRRLATYGLQRYIYDSLNYTPIDEWKYHHDRVSLLNNSVPSGYYSIFKEIVGMVVDLINAKVPVNDKTIPDISVGRCWSDYWAKNRFDSIYTARIKYSHNYPEYYPQSASNPQEAWCYPEASLAEFRQWFRDTYLPSKFPKYILTKANLLGGQQSARKIAEIFLPKTIG